MPSADGAAARPRGQAGAGQPAGPIGPAEQDALVEMLQALIRIPTVNPPGDEILAARYVDDLLRDEGLEPELLEPFPGRASIVARLRGAGGGGEPLLLLSHLDVVPAPAEGWRHDPFSGDVAGGFVWGRGAIDMKSTLATQLAVVRRLAAETRAAGRDPARDPVPGLRRDLVLAATADEEAGGFEGAGWIVDHRPELLQAAAALTEAGGIGLVFGGRRFYPIQVAERGFVVYRLTFRGTWGHGSVPRDDNAAVLAAEAVVRLTGPGAPRPTPVMERFIETVAAGLPPAAAAALRGAVDPDPTRSEAALAELCGEPYRRTLRAVLRDTISPDVIRAGVKYNVIPGTAEIEIDVRTLPGTDEAAMTAELRRRLGEALWERTSVEVTGRGAAVEAPTDSPLYRILEATLRDHDPAGVPVPVMAHFATDAKHLARIGVPTYGFSPLRLGPGDPYLELFHADDERVPLAGLRFGLSVLYDVVRRYCG